MLTWFNIEHDFIIAERSAHWHETSGESFTDYQDIRLSVLLVLVGHQFSCAAETGLDLIHDHEDIVFIAEFPDLLQISCIRNNDSSFTLYRLKKYGCNIFIGLKHLLHGWDVIKWD
jgi:hypothetical protein